MPSTTSLSTTPALPSSTSAWDANIWPEYPPVRYWHDLTYQPSKRPFYPFVHASVMVTPRLCRRDVTVQEQKALSLHERHWRETQEYWWNWNDDHDGGRVMEQMAKRVTNRENKQQTWTATLATVAYNIAAAPMKLYEQQSMTFMPITKDNVFSALLGLLVLILFIGFCASIAVLIGSLMYLVIDGLILQKHGKLRWVSQTPPIRYENVPYVRGWAVAPPNCASSILLRQE